MGKKEYLCPCLKITKKDVKEAIAGGADSFKEIKKETGAASKCGHCECRVKKYAKKKLKKQAEKAAGKKTVKR